jgi:N-acetylmuramoyl-L-alanine amidase
MAKRGRSAASRGSNAASRGGHRAASKPQHQQPWRIPLIAGLAVLLVVAASAFAIVQLTPTLKAPALTNGDDGPLPANSLAASDGVSATSTASAGLVPTGTVEVEVPDVVGKSMTTAEALLQTAGLVTITRVAGQARQGVAAEVVLAQTPSPGTRLKQGDTVMVTYNPRSSGTAALGSQPVVVIDAGHQEITDPKDLEPIGPGSTDMKEKVKGGTTGVATGIPEYKQTLAISLRLRDKLQAAGIKVVMIRTTNNVNIANSRRAIIGNEARAALVVRVHLDSFSDSSARGISTLYPAGNLWVKPIEVESRRAAALVQRATAKATGANDRGLFPRADMSGFNYSKVPTIIVECAFMSNPDDDRLVATPAYQDKLATGMSAGVLQYLGR